MFKEDGIDWSNICKSGLLSVIAVLFSLWIFIMVLDVNNIGARTEEIFSDISEDIKLREELIDTATIETSNVIVIDKSSKRYVGDPHSASYTKYYFEVQLEDGTIERVKVNFSEYDNTKVNDEVQVKLYRNDRYKELDSKATNNIVSIELMK